MLHTTLFFFHETLCVVWYHFYNLKNAKDTHAGVLLLVMLQTKACQNGTKLHKASQIALFTEHFLVL